MSTSQVSSPESSSFDALRARALERKEEARRALGLDSAAMGTKTGKKRRRRSRVGSEKLVAPVPKRRSARIRSMPAAEYTSSPQPPTPPSPPSSAPLPPPPSTPLTAAEAEMMLEGIGDGGGGSGESSKRLNADVKGLHGRWLGKSVPYALGGAGKQAKRACMLAMRGKGGGVKFSRMSGIQEWKNAVALFVNVGGVEYENLFLEGGKKMTWFAQQRQSQETPVILRMLSQTIPIVLFARLPSQPYVFLGTLVYCSHDPSVRPMQFVWSLKHYDTMQSNPKVQEIFRGEEGGGGGEE